MRYAQYPPLPALARLVECCWILEGDGAGVPDAIVPDGRVELIFHYGARFTRHHPDGRADVQRRAIVAGQMLQPVALSHIGRAGVAAIRLRPAAVRAVLGCSASDLTSRFVDVNELLAGAADIPERLAVAVGDRARVAIIETWLTRAAPAVPRRDIEAAVALILRTGGARRLPTIAAYAGVSVRQLERAFVHEVGLAPKTFARLVRLQSALRRISNGASLGETAIACGYFDQAHMTHDFRRLAEISPAAWRANAGVLAPLFVR